MREKNYKWILDLLGRHKRVYYIPCQRSFPWTTSRKHNGTHSIKAHREVLDNRCILNTPLSDSNQNFPTIRTVLEHCKINIESYFARLEIITPGRTLFYEERKNQMTVPTIKMPSVIKLSTLFSSTHDKRAKKSEKKSQKVMKERKEVELRWKIKMRMGSKIHLKKTLF